MPELLKASQALMNFPMNNLKLEKKGAYAPMLLILEIYLFVQDHYKKKKLHVLYNRIRKNKYVGITE